MAQGYRWLSTHRDVHYSKLTARRWVNRTNNYSARMKSSRRWLATVCKQGTVYRRTEIEAVSAEGKLRRLGATVAPIELPPERGPRGALCLLTDITEVTELREQVALKNNLESLGEMSAGLAHEFKNAIATLQGYAQLLQSHGAERQRPQVAAGIVADEVRNLSGMVTAFLNFARPAAVAVGGGSCSRVD
jgi:signal transduction histidine kinase